MFATTIAPGEGTDVSRSFVTTVWLLGSAQSRRQRSGEWHIVVTRFVGPCQHAESCHGRASLSNAVRYDRIAGSMVLSLLAK